MSISWVTRLEFECLKMLSVAYYLHFALEKLVEDKEEEAVKLYERNNRELHALAASNLCSGDV